MKHFYFLNLIVLLVFGCQKSNNTAASATVSGPNTLYVATGACNSGQGVTTYTVANATKTIEKINLSTGNSLGALLDYNVLGYFSSATHPQNIIDQGDSILALNENATTTSERRVIKIPKSAPSSFLNYYANVSVLSGILRGMDIDSQGSLFIGKTTAIEKVNSTPVRIPAGANPWVNAPAGTCATSTTSLTAVAMLPTAFVNPGRIIFAHQGATAALNRLGIVANTGYFVAADCLGGVQISSVTHTKASNLTAGTVAFNANGTSPTAMLYINSANATATGRLIVAYSNSQTSNNNAGAYNLNHGVVIWDVTETSTTATLTNPIVLFDDATILYGISAMAYDSTNAFLYVATGGEPAVANFTTNTVGYNIEKFHLDLSTPASPTLTRVTTSNQSFVRGGAHTRCISGMALGNE